MEGVQARIVQMLTRFLGHCPQTMASLSSREVALLPFRPNGNEKIPFLIELRTASTICMDTVAREFLGVKKVVKDVHALCARPDEWSQMLLVEMALSVENDWVRPNHRFGRSPLRCWAI